MAKNEKLNWTKFGIQQKMNWKGFPFYGVLLGQYTVIYWLLLLVTTKNQQLPIKLKLIGVYGVLIGQYFCSVFSLVRFYYSDNCRKMSQFQLLRDKIQHMLCCNLLIKTKSDVADPKLPRERNLPDFLYSQNTNSQSFYDDHTKDFYPQ